MAPANSTFDTAHMACANTIILRNFSLKARIFADGLDLLFRQLCIGAALTSIACAVLYSVSLICGCGVPSQVANEIVLWVAISVTAFMFFWWGANKSEKDKAVNFQHFAFVFNPQKNAQAAIFWALSRSFYPVSFHRFYAAMVGHFVKSLKANNWFPSFHLFHHKYSRYGIVPDWSTVC